MSGRSRACSNEFNLLPKFLDIKRMRLITFNEIPGWYPRNFFNFIYSSELLYSALHFAIFISWLNISLFEMLVSIFIIGNTILSFLYRNREKILNSNETLFKISDLQFERVYKNNHHSGAGKVQGGSNPAPLKQDHFQRDHEQEMAGY